MKKFFVFAFVTLYLFCAISVSANEGLKEDFDYSNEDFRDTVDMLSMEGHGNDDYSSCSVKQLYYQEVAEMFEKGMTKQEILDYYVKELGISALKAPPKNGFNLSLWITPFLIIFIVFVFLYYVIRKWKRKFSGLILEDGSQSFDLESEIYSTVIEEERKKYI